MAIDKDDGIDYDAIEHMLNTWKSGFPRGYMDKSYQREDRIREYVYLLESFKLESKQVIGNEKILRLVQNAHVETKKPVIRDILERVKREWPIAVARKWPADMATHEAADATMRAAEQAAADAAGSATPTKVELYPDRDPDTIDIADFKGLPDIEPEYDLDYMRELGMIKDE